jgi:hypothetical protein
MGIIDVTGEFREIPDDGPRWQPGDDPDAGDNGGYPVVWVHVVCGCYVGRYKWQTLDVYEPDECSYEADIRVDADSFADHCASITCPKCGSELHQDDGNMELIDAPGDAATGT